MKTLAYLAWFAGAVALAFGQQSSKTSNGGTLAAADVTASLLSGTRELNTAKSRFNPGPGPRSEIRTYSITPDGRQHATYDLVEADGKRVRSTGSPHRWIFWEWVRLQFHGRAARATLPVAA
jgi:hypothetical protein